ncbi:MAG TPA: HNH endonuclease [Phycisphaerae bacterium]|nr:HNH endonuclease [Phycisphaerae bacterium]
MDDKDYESLNRHKWYVMRARVGHWCAGRDRSRADHSGPKTIYMHREILGAPKHLWVDHINGNPLDNRRENLRLATPTLNSRNYRRRTPRKKHRLPMGVDQRGRRFGATLCKNNRLVWLGLYDTPEAAHAAYLSARAESIEAEKRLMEKGCGL